MNTRIFTIAVPLAWTAIVFVLHVMPISIRDESDFHIPHADKVVHFGMFAVLSFLVMRSLVANKAEETRLHLLFITWLACAAFGGLMEYIQGLTPAQRDSDINDWYADCAGIIFGTWLSLKKILPFFFRHQVRKSA